MARIFIELMADKVNRSRKKSQASHKSQIYLFLASFLHSMASILHGMGFCSQHMA